MAWASDDGVKRDDSASWQIEFVPFSNIWHLSEKVVLVQQHFSDAIRRYTVLQ